MEQPQHILRANAGATKSPARRVGSLGIVALLHIGALLGVTAGLATHFGEKLPDAIVADVAPPPPPKDVPPPPPPETVKPPPPPVVPPPDIVIQQEVSTPPPITVAVAKPQAGPANPMEGVVSAVKARNVDCSKDHYPALSARMHETGTVGISMIIGTDGVPKDVKVEKSSGHPRLDEAAVECVKAEFRYKAATKDGVPLEIPGHPSIVWNLN